MTCGVQNGLVGREQRAREALQAIWSTSGMALSASSRHLIYSLRSITLMRAQYVELALKVRRATSSRERLAHVGI